MTPELYSILSDNDVDSFCIGDPDIEHREMKFIQTALGPTAFVQVNPAPSFTGRHDAVESSYFVAPERIIVDVSSPLLQSHKFVNDVICSKYSNVALFIKGVDLSNWCYVGSATVKSAKLGSVNWSNAVHWKYTYTLDQRLPMALWSKVGGFKRWLLLVGLEEHPCSTPDECLAIVRSHWGSVANDVQVLRYEGDSMLAVTNEAGQCFLYYSAFYLEGEHERDKMSTNPAYQGDSTDTVEFYGEACQDLYPEAAYVISKQAGLSIIERFITSGDPGDMTE